VCEWGKKGGNSKRKAVWFYLKSLKGKRKAGFLGIEENYAKGRVGEPTQKHIEGEKVGQPAKR